MSLDELRQIKIGELWSFGDLGLLLKAGWSLSPPTPKTIYVDIPESDGELDLSEALTGDVHYKQSSFSATLLFRPESAINWERKRLKLANEVHGRKLKLVLPDRPEEYLIGRFSVGALKIDGAIASVDISATLEPWFYRQKETTYKFSVIGEKTIYLHNSRKTVVPKVTTTAPIMISQGIKTASVGIGTYSLVDFPLFSGNNTLSVSAELQAEVTITYQEASL